MKIALIRHMMDDPQGGARLVALLARDLVEMGEDVTLYCYGYDAARCFPNLLAEVPVRAVRRLDGFQAERRHETGWRRSWLQIRRYYLESAAVASLVDPQSDVLNPHEWPAHRAAALVGLRRGIPIVWTYNDPNRWHLGGDRRIRDWPYRLFGRLESRQVNRFAAVATLSRWMTAVAQRNFRVPLHLVRCGIDVRSLPAQQTREVPRSAGSSDPALGLLSVGVLAPQRRLEDAIQGVKLALDRGWACRYEIIGSDRFAPAYADFLRGLVDRLGLGDVVRLRFESVSETELERAYAAADALVFPNEQQAWGLAQLEALARGIPIIVSTGAGVSEVLADGVEALLVEPRRPDQICSAIGRLVTSPSFRVALGEGGRRLVLERYTSVEYARRMLDLFRRCAARAPSPQGPEIAG